MKRAGRSVQRSLAIHRKMSMEPENGGLEDVFPFQLVDFRVEGCFQGCIVFKFVLVPKKHQTNFPSTSTLAAAASFCPKRPKLEASPNSAGWIFLGVPGRVVLGFPSVKMASTKLEKNG